MLVCRLRDSPLAAEKETVDVERQAGAAQAGEQLGSSGPVGENDEYVDSSYPREGVRSSLNLQRYRTVGKTFLDLPRACMKRTVAREPR